MTLTSVALYSQLCADLSSYVLHNSSVNWLLFGDTPAVEDEIKTQAACRMVDRFLSKERDDPLASADEVALNKFLQVNDACSTWTSSFPDEYSSLLMGCLRQTVYDFFMPWSAAFEQQIPLFSHPDDVFGLGKSGNGASQGSRGHTSFYAKMFAGALTASTSTLVSYYEHYRLRDPRWNLAESIRREKHGLPKVVESSHLSFVPKKRTVSRTVCTEPALNMRFQLGIAAIVRKRLKTFFNIDLSTQPDVNRELARRGSLDNSIATIDLESASDSISLNLFKWLIPQEVQHYFLISRCSSTILPSGERVPLNMVSSMGNGYTFPLQTAIFSCIVRTAYHLKGITPPKASLTTWSVFGDDIIVPLELQPVVYDLLSLCGFVVNKSKSFIEGPFRESCGFDAYKGVDIRPVYLKTLANQPSVFALFNALVEWGTRHRLALPKTLSYLLKFVPWQCVPLWENANAGLRIPLGRVGLIRMDNNGSPIYTRTVPVPLMAKVMYNCIKVPENVARLSFNSAGLWLCLLEGSVRGMRIGLREEDVTYDTTSNVGPGWDYIARDSTLHSVEWRDLEWFLTKSLERT